MTARKKNENVDVLVRSVSELRRIVSDLGTVELRACPVELREQLAKQMRIAFEAFTELHQIAVEALGGREMVRLGYIAEKARLGEPVYVAVGPPVVAPAVSC